VELRGGETLNSPSSLVKEYKISLEHSILALLFKLEVYKSQIIIVSVGASNDAF
jgi:hypothetical protein